MPKRILVATIGVLLLCLSAGCDRRIDVDFNYALEQNDFDWARELLDEGARVDAQYILAKGNTNLMMFVRKDEYDEGIQFLLDHGADLDLQNYDGRTALFIAANAGKLRHVSALIDAGADLNVRNQSGDTALKTAYDKGHKIIERVIREAGGTY